MAPVLFLVVCAGRASEPASSMRAAAEVLLRWCEADPDVTCMPYVVRGDGSPLTEDDYNELDLIMAGGE